MLLAVRLNISFIKFSCVLGNNAGHYNLAKYLIG